MVGIWVKSGLEWSLTCEAGKIYRELGWRTSGMTLACCKQGIFPLQHENTKTYNKPRLNSHLGYIFSKMVGGVAH